MKLSHTIIKKKRLGQHFLNRHDVVDTMLNYVEISPATTVVEIGCGDGILTKAILEHTPCKKLIVYEVDPEWASYVQKKISDLRLEMNIINVLESSWESLQNQTPLVLLANLPYNITWPIMSKIQENKHLFTQGIVMVQEEVAQKLVAQRGRPYGFSSLFYQYHFTLTLLDKIPPEAFTPAPKVFSRLIHFKPKDMPVIPQSDHFWAFIKLCFRFPRQLLKNNIQQTHYDVEKIPERMRGLRAQQMGFDMFLELWDSVR